MLLTASEYGNKIRVLDALTGEVIPTDQVDTTEGWIDLYLARPGKTKDGFNKLFVDRRKREIAKVRLYTDFDVVTRRGRKLFKVRWTMLLHEEPRVIETRLGPLPK